MSGFGGAQSGGQGGGGQVGGGGGGGYSGSGSYGSGMPAAPTSNKTYYESKATRELMQLNEHLKIEIKEKDELIRQLQEQTHRGSLQKTLQNTLREHRNMKKILDEYMARASHEDELQTENEEQLGQITSLKDELLRIRSEYDVELRALVQENDQLRDEVETKERQLLEVEKEAAGLEDQIETHMMDKKAQEEYIDKLEADINKLKDGTQVRRLEERLTNCTEVLQERDREHEVLIQELQKMEMEMEELQAATQKDKHGIMTKKGAQLHEAREEIARLLKRSEFQQREYKRVDLKNEALEKEKAEQDEYIFELRTRLSKLSGELGMGDVMEDLRSYKAKLTRRGDEINELTMELNERSRELQKWMAENRALRERYNVPDEWGLTEEDVKMESVVDLQKAKSLNAHYQTVIAKLEADRLELLNDLRKGTVLASEAGLRYLGLSHEKTMMLNEYAERLRNDDTSLPVSDRARELKAELTKCQKELEFSRSQYYKAVTEKQELSDNSPKQLLLELQKLKGEMQTARTLFAKAVGPDGRLPNAAVSSSSSSAGSTDSGVHGSLAEMRSAMQQLAVLSQTMNSIDQQGLMGRLQQLFATSHHHQHAATGGGSGGVGIGPAGSSSSSSAPGPSTKLLSEEKKRHEAATATKQAVDQTPAADLALHVLAVNDLPMEVPPPAAGGGIEAKETKGDGSNGSGPPHQHASGQLLGSLAQLIDTERALRRSNDALEVYKHRFEELSAQQQLVYDDMASARHAWKKERSELKRQLSEVHAAKEQLEQELARVGDASTIKRLLERGAAAIAAERKDGTAGDGPGTGESQEFSSMDKATREILVLRVNQKVLGRRYNSCKGELDEALEQEKVLRRELVEMEAVLKARVVQLVASKERAEARALHMERVTLEWVPREQLRSLARAHATLQQGHAALMSQYSQAAKEHVELLELRERVALADARVSELSDELSVEKKGSKALRGNMQKLERALDEIKNPDDSGAGAEESLPSISKLMAEKAELEVKESSARKRADRAGVAVSQAQGQISTLEKEVASLEQQLAEARQQYEHERGLSVSLRNKLDGSIPHSKAIALHADLHNLSKELTQARIELKETKATSRLAVRQAMAMTQLPRTRTEMGADGGESGQSMPDAELDLVAELSLMKQALRDLQERSDEQGVVGRLHRQLVAAKMSIRQMERKLAASQGDVTTAQRGVLQLEKEIDARNAELFRLHTQFRTQLADREQKIVQLSDRPSSRMTIQQAEVLHVTNARLMTRLEKERKELLAQKEATGSLRLRTEELEVQLAEDQKLLQLLEKKDKDAAALGGLVSGGGGGGGGAGDGEYVLRLRESVRESAGQVKKLRLQELKLQHALRTQQTRLAYLEANNAEHEAALGSLQERLVAKQSEIEEKEVQWQERQAEALAQEQRLKLALGLKQVSRSTRRLVRSRGTPGGGGGRKKKTKGGSESKGSSSSKQQVLDESELQAQNDSVLAGEEEESFDVSQDGSEYSIHSQDGGEVGDAGDGGRRADMLPGRVPVGRKGVKWGVIARQMGGRLEEAKKIMTRQAKELRALKDAMLKAEKEREVDKLQFNNSMTLSNGEKERILHTAQQQISSLHKQLSSKNEAIVKHQHMIQRMRDDFNAQRDKDAQEIERLDALVFEGRDRAMTKLQSALSFLDKMPVLPEGVMSVKQVEEVLSEKNSMITVLHREIEELQVQVNQARAGFVAAPPGANKGPGGVDRTPLGSPRRSGRSTPRTPGSRRTARTPGGAVRPVTAGGTAGGKGLRRRILQPGSSSEESKEEEKEEKVAVEGEEQTATDAGDEEVSFVDPNSFADMDSLRQAFAQQQKDVKRVRARMQAKEREHVKVVLGIKDKIMAAETQNATLEDELQSRPRQRELADMRKKHAAQLAKLRAQLDTAEAALRESKAAVEQAGEGEEGDAKGDEKGTASDLGDVKNDAGTATAAAKAGEKADAGAASTADSAEGAADATGGASRKQLNAANERASALAADLKDAQAAQGVLRDAIARLNKEKARLQSRLKHAQAVAAGGGAAEGRSDAAAADTAPKSLSQQEREVKKAKKDAARLALLERSVAQLRVDKSRLEAQLKSAKLLVEQLQSSAASQVSSGDGKQPPAAAEGNAMTVWAANKKLERRVAQAKAKLAHTREMLEAEKSKLAAVNEQLVKEGRQKGELVQRLQKAEIAAAAAASSSSSSSSVASAAAPDAKTLSAAKTAERLKQQLFECEEARDRLAKELKVGQRERVLKLEGELTRLKARLASSEQQVADLRASRKKLSGSAALDAAMQQEMKTDAVQRENNRIKGKIDSLSKEILDAQCKNFDLQYEHEHNSVALTRLRVRVAELDQFNRLLMASDAGPVSAAGGAADGSAAAAAGVDDAEINAALKRGPDEVQRVIASLKRVIAKLQHDNRTLRGASKSNVKYMEIKRQNKQMKARLAQLEADLSAAEKKAEEKMAGDRRSLQGQVERLTSLNRAVSRSLKKETDAHAKVKRQWQTASDRADEQARLVEDLRAETETLTSKLAAAHDTAGQVDPSKEAALRRTIGELTRKNKKANVELAEQRTLLAQMRTQMRELAALVEQIKERERQRLQVQQQRKQQQKEQEQKARRRRQQQQAQGGQADVGGGEGGHDDEDGFDSKQQTDDSSSAMGRMSDRELARENVRLRREVRAYKNELKDFDEAFFDEIEDLKYRHALLQEELRACRKPAHDHAAVLAAHLPPTGGQQADDGGEEM